MLELSENLGSKTIVERPGDRCGRAAALEHFGVVTYVAEEFGLSAADIFRATVDRLCEPNSVLSEELSNTDSDYEQAKLVALAALLEAQRLCPPGEIKSGAKNILELASRVERMPDPILRDTIYSHFWQGNSAESIGVAQSLRTLTVRQNLRRALKLLDTDS